MAKTRNQSPVTYPTTYPDIVAKLIEILLSVGKPRPITEDTLIGDKADAILAKVNTAFFPPGTGFKAGVILQTEPVSQLAFEIIRLQGA
jgi:hypothetical protein